MNRSIIKEVEDLGFKYGNVPNEYNETRHQILYDNVVIYESYNEYCLSSFVKGVVWKSKNC